MSDSEGPTLGHADGKTYHRRREPCCEDEARRYLATLDAARPAPAERRTQVQPLISADEDDGVAAARPSGEVDVERLRAAAKDIDDGWHVVDEGREQVRLRYASDLPVRLRRLRAALDGEEGT